MTAPSETGFRYPFFRDFKKRLGEADSAVQFAEIAIREVSVRLKAASDQKEFLQALAREHRVKTDYVDLDHAHHQLSRLHIIAISGEFGQFLDDLRDTHPNRLLWTPKGNLAPQEETLDEHMESKRKRKKKEKKPDALVGMIRNLGFTVPDARQRLGPLDYDLYQYYRLCRNLAAHAEGSPAGTDSKVGDLQERARQDDDYRALDAPNELVKLAARL